jgi:alpha-tubulin suppressor-like RCC1 family protein
MDRIRLVFVVASIVVVGSGCPNPRRHAETVQDSSAGPDAREVDASLDAVGAMDSPTATDGIVPDTALPDVPTVQPGDAGSSCPAEACLAGTSRCEPGGGIRTCIANGSCGTWGAEVPCTPYRACTAGETSCRMNCDGNQDCRTSAFCSSRTCHLDAVQMATGNVGNTCALLADGTLRCWGWNQYGQLGDGTTSDRGAPVAVSGVSGATDLATSGGHTCAIVSGESVRCWGSNSDGQLGDGTLMDRALPVEVHGLSGATAVATGSHTCAILAGGSVKCWGRNLAGELGDGTNTNRPTPVSVTGVSGVRAIVAGIAHTCALLGGGAVRCWGQNSDGQVGDGSNTDRATPVDVVGLDGTTTVAIALAAGSRHTCALVSDGSVRCWGNNFAGQLGDGTGERRSMPVRPELLGASSIAAGGGHSCAVLSSGGVRCWGSNFKGQLGDGTTTDRPTPTMVGGLSGVTAIVAGGENTCALMADGSLKCWGSNELGRLGNGGTENSSSPVAVSGW